MFAAASPLPEPSATLAAPMPCMNCRLVHFCTPRLFWESKDVPPRCKISVILTKSGHHTPRVATRGRIMTMRRFLILALSLIGLFDSVYLLWVYTSPSHPLVCLGTGCDVARASSYSHLWGLPLPLFGVAMYGALALLAFGESLGGAVLYAVIRYATLAIAAVGFIASLVLSGIEALCFMPGAPGACSQPLRWS